MNTRNEWKNLLDYANKELAKYGVSIEINDNEDEGFFKCEILVEGKHFETYAENFYEEELPDLVTDAWHYALNKFGKFEKNTYICIVKAIKHIYKICPLCGGKARPVQRGWLVNQSLEFGLREEGHIIKYSCKNCGHVFEIYY